MSVPWRSAPGGRGLLLLRGRPDGVAAWCRRGIVPVHLVPLQGWTAVAAAGPSRAMPPYDDALAAFAGRPVPLRLRWGIGLFAVNGKAVVTVHPHRWRGIQRWLVWEPTRGLVQPGRLPLARVDDLVHAADAQAGPAGWEVTRILRGTAGDAPTTLTALAEALGLPGAGLLDGRDDPESLDGWRLVEPGEVHVARFDTTVTDEARAQAELEED